MDNDFAKKAFDKSEKARMEKEAEAWDTFHAEQDTVVGKLSFNITVATMIGPDKFGALIQAAESAKVTEILFAYKTYAMRLGFKGGYQAGQMSMIEEAAK